MTPQEKDLIAALLGRLGQAAGQAKDPEADQLIRQAVAAQPDAPYLLVQTVLIQDMALHQAQGRIADLDRQLAEAKAAQASRPAEQPTSFLGGLFGLGSGAAAPPPASVPPAGPWSRPAPAQQAAPQYAQQQPNAQQPYAQQPYPAPGQPMMAPGMMGGGMMGGGFGGGGFLRSAATTAAGIAGGALLFEGIQSMFGGHGGGMLGGSAMQPGLSETVINNYYENDPNGGGAPQATAWDQPAGADPGVDYASASDSGNDPGGASDPGFAPDTDYASDTDFSGDDGGGSGDDYA
jgi:uncharacterized protein